MKSTELISLCKIMRQTAGSNDVLVGLIDGPVASDYPFIEQIPTTIVTQRSRSRVPSDFQDPICRHGTLVASVMFARRECAVPGICPECKLLVRQIYSPSGTSELGLVAATVAELAQAILDCIRLGAKVINVSAAITVPAADQEAITTACDIAAARGVLIVAAAGNDGVVGSSILTRHPWVVPVVPANSEGRPLHYSNFSASVGRNGVMAPGENIAALGIDGEPTILNGSSIATPFVSGTAALLLSLHPWATGTQVRSALRGRGARRATIIPPLLDAELAKDLLLAHRRHS